MKREDSVLTSIRNKSVIVTGGTKGIGKGIAGVFAQLGAQVCLLGRNEPDGAATAEALRSRGSTVIFCRGDVKEQGDMEEVMATVAGGSVPRIGILWQGAPCSDHSTRRRRVYPRTSRRRWLRGAAALKCGRKRKKQHHQQEVAKGGT